MKSINILVDSKNNDLESIKYDVSFLITHKCNLQCIHCCENADIENKCDSELSYIEIKNIIDSINISEINSINITGGEPLIRNDIKEICMYLREKFSGKISLSTNGILINKNNVEWITTVFDNISISLDGWTSDITDLIRGKGVFTSVIDRIKLIQKYNFSNIYLSCLLPPSHMAEMKFTELCEKLKVKPIFRQLTEMGRGFDNKNKINKLFDDYINMNGYDKYEEIESYSLPNNCKAGISKISIDSYGNIYPCNLIRESKFCLGNIKMQSSIFKVINNSLGEKNLIQEKKFINTKCKDCSVNYFCWSCFKDYLILLNDEMGFEERCKVRKKRLYKEIWGVEINE